MYIAIISFHIWNARRLKVCQAKIMQNPVAQINLWIKMIVRAWKCCPSILPSYKDAFTIAFNLLERVARENAFAIHSVPYDGNCLFSSIAYQLGSIAACTVDKSTLRQMVADHLENNSNLYKRFLSQPVVSHDPYNADTEPPTAQDAYIETIADH